MLRKVESELVNLHNIMNFYVSIEPEKNVSYIRDNVVNFGKVPDLESDVI